MPGGGRPRRRASETRQRRACREERPPPTGRARRSAPARPARARWERRGRVEGGADGREEPAEERVRSSGEARRVELLSLCGEGGDRRVTAGDPRGRRLDDGQGADELGMRRCCKERDDTSVRVPDEVVAGHQGVCHEGSIVLEVDPVDGRLRREAGRSSTTSSKRAASGRCADHVPGRRQRSRGRARSAPSGDRNVLQRSRPDFVQ